MKTQINTLIIITLPNVRHITSFVIKLFLHLYHYNEDCLFLLQELPLLTKPHVLSSKAGAPYFMVHFSSSSTQRISKLKFCFNEEVPFHASLSAFELQHISSTLEISLECKKKFREELITYFPLMRHGPYRKRPVEQLFYCCLCNHCRGNDFT
jgi:hypothetical protein